MLGINDWIAILIAFFTNLGAAYAFFENQKRKQTEFELNMNIEIAKLNEKYVALNKEVSDHKDGNRESFTKLESMVFDNTKNNREDHGKLFDKLEKVSSDFVIATRVLIGNTK